MLKSFVSAAACLLLGVAPAVAGWDEGVAAFTKKDYKTAVAEFQKVVDQNPDAHSGHYMLGLSLRGLDRKEEALNHIRKAYDLNPNDLAIKLALGQSYTDVRRYRDAAKLLGTVADSEVAALDARRKGAFYKMRALAREQAGDETGAYADYKKLAAMYPEDAQIQHKYGVLASNNDDMREALTALDRAARAAKNDPDIKKSYIAVLKKQGRHQNDRNAKRQTYLRAVNLAKELVALDPSFDNVLLLCEVELGASAYSDAIASCQKAVSEKPNNWLPLYYLGQAYSSDKQFQEAEAPLAKAAGLTSKPAELRQIWKQIGFVHEKQKEYSQSIEAYEKAGDGASVARVRKNEETARDNAAIEAENKRIEEMAKEAAELEKQLKELEEGGGGG